MKHLKFNTRLVFVLIFVASFAKFTFSQESDAKGSVQAQKAHLNTNRFTDNWYIGVRGGATFFLSPLKDNPFSWGAGASLGKQLNTKIALRLDYSYLNLKSDGYYVRKNDDGSYYKNNLAMDAELMEIALILKLNLNDFFYSKSPKYLREFYLFTGGAYDLYRTKVTNEEGAYVIGTGYSNVGEKEAMASTIAIPIGLGVTYKLGQSDKINLNAEFGYRYVQNEELNGGLSNSTSDYTFTSLGLIFNLGKPTRTTQKITSDIVKDELEESLSAQIDQAVNEKMDAEVKPLQEDVKKQAAVIADNQEQLDILQEEMEVRTNAIKDQIGNDKYGVTSGSNAGTGVNMKSIYFAFNSTYITPAMEREIAVIAKILRKNKDMKCELVGNSSNVGSPEYNMQLSIKRTDAVLKLFVEEFGINTDRFIVSNKGVDDPLAKNNKSLNRRVDLIIK